MYDNTATGNYGFGLKNPHDQGGVVEQSDKDLPFDRRRQSGPD